MNRFGEQVASLLASARAARQIGDLAGLRALASAVLALDPENAEAEDLLVGSARRRQMTLMFCDVVGSTAIADSRDPEETSRILRTYRSVCNEVVARHRGFVHDHQGDGMLVLFGYTGVAEDDVHRAVQCGLEIIRILRDRVIEVHVRVAVHTDLVMIDGGGVTGATSNEAARIQSLADPDTVVISDTTEAIVRGWFDTRSLGPVRLRGVSRPIEVFTVLGNASGSGHHDPSTSSPFTGRRTELDVIRSLWTDTTREWRDGVAASPSPSSHGLLVTGPAGVGKTRLLAEVQRQTGAPAALCHCSRYQVSTSLYPFRTVLEEACGIVVGDDAERRLTRLRDRLAREDVPAGDLPFLAAALRIPTAGLKPPPEVEASVLRDIALHVAAGFVRSRSADGPAAVFVDDLQWADRSTLDLLMALLAAPSPGLMIVLATRDGFTPPWPQHLVRRIDLGPLRDTELRELASRILVASSLDPDKRAEVIARSDGMPLYLEELIRTAEALVKGEVIHRSIRLSEHGIPAALRDPLLARLAAPGVDLDLAQTAATLGREIDRGMLRRTAEMGAHDLDAALQTLFAAGLVEPLTEGTVRFRHELIREVAYETQPFAVRRSRHSRIADHLMTDAAVAGQMDTGPVTFHLERADRLDEAIAVSTNAALTDQQIGAHAEATRRLTQALQMVQRLVAGSERERTELGVRELRSFSAIMSDGYASPMAAEDHRRCVELCELAGLRLELLPSLIRSWSYFAFRGDLVEADSVNERVHATGMGMASRQLFVAGRSTTEFFRGRFTEARDTIQAFVNHPWSNTPSDRPPPEWSLPSDPVVSLYGVLVADLWILGEQGAAQKAAEDGMRRAKALEFPFGPFSVGFLTSLVALTRRMAGDHQAARQLGQEMIALAERHGFPMYHLVGAIQTGLTDVRDGKVAALDDVIQSIVLWRAMLVGDLWTPFWLTELARVQAMVGAHADALRSLDDAAAVAADKDNSFYAAETLRTRGELLCSMGDPDGVADIERALELAVRQGAVAFAALARDSLAHLAVR